MICRNCGKEVPNESTFCSHCGCDLRISTSSNFSHTPEEQVPLLLLIKKISKHKIASIISVLVVALSIGSYIAIKKHQKKEKAKAAATQEFNHFLNLLGTYKNNNISLVLLLDNTAIITYKGYWSEKKSRGHWREKYDGLIEIDFSEPLEDIYIGNKKRSYCRTLYLVGTTLWESMSAINSNDYEACERLKKEKSS